MRGKYVELIRAPADQRERETHLLDVEGNVWFVIKMFSHWPGVRRDGELRYWDGNYVVSIIPSTRERSLAPITIWWHWWGGYWAQVIRGKTNTTVVWPTGSAGHNNLTATNISNLSPRRNKRWDFTSASPSASAPSLLLSGIMTLLKMQTSPPGHSSPRRTGMFASECQSCRWDIVAPTSTRLQETYWRKKCHKKDSHWIFKVSNMMFPSVAQSRWAIRKPSSRSYQSIHEHKKSSHTMDLPALLEV